MKSNSFLKQKIETEEIIKIQKKSVAKKEECQLKIECMPEEYFFFVLILLR